MSLDNLSSGPLYPSPIHSASGVFGNHSITSMEAMPGEDSVPAIVQNALQPVAPAVETNSLVDDAKLILNNLFSTALHNVCYSIISRHAYEYLTEQITRLETEIESDTENSIQKVHALNETWSKILTEIPKYEKYLATTPPNELNILYENVPIAAEDQVKAFEDALNRVDPFLAELKEQFKEEFGEDATLDEIDRERKRLQPDVSVQFIQHSIFYITDVVLDKVGSGSFADVKKIQAYKLAASVNKMAVSELFFFAGKLGRTPDKVEFANMVALWKELSREEEPYILPPLGEIQENPGYITKLYDGNLSKIDKLGTLAKVEMTKCILRSLSIIMKHGFLLGDIKPMNMLYKMKVVHPPTNIIGMIEAMDTPPTPEQMRDFNQAFYKWASLNMFSPDVKSIKKLVDDLEQMALFKRMSEKIDNPLLNSYLYALMHFPPENVQSNRKALYEVHGFFNTLFTSSQAQYPTPSVISKLEKNLKILYPQGIPKPGLIKDSDSLNTIKAGLKAIKFKADISAVLSDYGGLVHLKDLIHNPTKDKIEDAIKRFNVLTPEYTGLVEHEAILKDLRKALTETDPTQTLAGIVPKIEQYEILSLGVSLYKILTNRFLYTHKLRYLEVDQPSYNPSVLTDNLIKAGVANPTLIKLIVQMVHWDPTQRPTRSELENELPNL